MERLLRMDFARNACERIPCQCTPGQPVRCACVSAQGRPARCTESPRLSLAQARLTLKGKSNILAAVVALVLGGHITCLLK